MFIVALGLMLIGTQQPSKNADFENGGKQHDTAVKNDTSPTSTYKPYAQRLSDSCYNAKDHDAADLCAQWRAALAAERAADESRLATIAAIVGAVLSLATVVGLIVTIWQTHGALGEARRSNRISLMLERRSRRAAKDAAADQRKALAIADRNAATAESHVALASKTADTQLRPYLGIEKILPETPGPTDNEIVVVIKNFGLSPAQNVIQEIGIHYAPRGNDAWPVPIATLELGREIQPGHIQKAKIGLDAWSPEWDHVLAGRGVFKIILRIRYTGLAISRAPLEVPIIFSKDGSSIPPLSVKGPMKTDV